LQSPLCVAAEPSLRRRKEDDMSKPSHLIQAAFQRAEFATRRRCSCCLNAPFAELVSVKGRLAGRRE
jgi:hypothetical protein